MAKTKKRGKKTPHLKQSPLDKKASRAEKPYAGNFDKQKPVWSFHIVDKDGPWAWKLASSADHWPIIFNSFPDFEGMNWSEIKQRGSHSVKVKDLVGQAQQRLRKIKQDDLDELFSLRINARCRVWGIPDGQVLKVLWYDPKHQVCPSTKRHT